jgi:hypothetical protein
VRIYEIDHLVTLSVTRAGAPVGLFGDMDDVRAHGRDERVGEDVSEKLDYTPGVFQVERHIRGKWTCTKCQTLIQAPVNGEAPGPVPTAGV